MGCITYPLILLFPIQKNKNKKERKTKSLVQCCCGICIRLQNLVCWFLVFGLIQGFTYPVRTHFLENILEVTGYRLTPFNQIDDYGEEKMWKMSKQAPRKRKSQIASLVEVCKDYNATTKTLMLCKFLIWFFFSCLESCNQDALRVANFKEYSPQTKESLSCWNPDCIGFNLIEYLLCHICEKERPGAVLVFMTGWDDINSLKDKLQAHPILGDSSRVLLLTCHGSMASSEQVILLFNSIFIFVFIN